MTLTQALAAAKTFGAPSVKHENGDTFVAIKTRDLNFDGLIFNKAGLLYRMDIYSSTKTVGDDSLSDLSKAMRNSSMYRKAIQVFGAPNDTSEGDTARWKNSNGSYASYSLDGDTVEVLTNEER